MTPPPDPLTPERILEATEEVLRRYGPAKATVVDVARVLGVSHGSVYRHFRTKTALHEAVTGRWLTRTELALTEILEASAQPAPDRLRQWLEALFEAKRHKAGDDPELFATYEVLMGGSTVVEDHIRQLVGQLREIIAEGVEEGRFSVDDPGSAAQAVFDATARFHDPGYAAEWQKPAIGAEFAAVSDLLLRGLRA